MKIKLLVFFLLLYNSSLAQNTQEALALRVGVNAQYSFVQSKANFSALPAVPRPNLNTSDITSNSYNVAAFAEYNFWQWLSLGLNFGYMPIVSNFENYENSIIGIDGVPTPIQFKHKLDTKLDYFSVFPYLKITMWELANIRLGSRLFFLANSNFSQEQSIVSPLSYDFVYPPKKYNGKIPSANNLVAAFNSSLSIPIYSFSNYQIEATTEYSFALQNVVSGIDWKNNSLSFGLQASYNFQSSQIIRNDTIVRRDTIISFIPNLAQEQISLLGTDNELQRERSEDITVNTYYINEKYERQVPKPKSLLTGKLELSFINSANIEAKNTIIPVKKMIQIDNFFAINQGIKAGQIKFNKLFSILDTNDFTQVPKIKFKALATSEAGLKSWEIKVFLKDKLVKTFAGDEDNINEEILWDLNKDISEHLYNELKYTLTLEDFDNQRNDASNGIIKFEYDKSSKIYEKKESNYYTIPLSELNSIDNKELESNFYAKISKCAIILGKNSTLTNEQIALVKLLAEKYQINYEENPNPKTMSKLIETSISDMLIFYSK